MVSGYFFHKAQSGDGNGLDMVEAPNRFELIGYLEEALAPEDMVRIEERLRSSPEWRQALLELQEQVDLGEHSVATIWRRHRLTCPSRERLGTYLLGALDPQEADYIKFHLEVGKCRWCLANLTDLQPKDRKPESDEHAARRRKCIFASSARYLPGNRK